MNSAKPGIDNDLLVESAEQVVVMNNGCICCTVRGDLVRILGEIGERRAAGELDFERVIIRETRAYNSERPNAALDVLATTLGLPAALQRDTESSWQSAQDRLPGRSHYHWRHRAAALAGRRYTREHHGVSRSQPARKCYPPSV